VRSIDDSKKLAGIVDQYAEIFRGDKNMGLVQQVLARMEMVKIAALRGTFSAIEVVDVAKRVYSEENPSPDQISRIEDLILRMVPPGEQGEG
jgi:hypothetical protein